MLRLSPDLNQKLKMVCAYHNTSANRFITALIEAAVADFEHENGALPTPAKKNAAARDGEKKEPP